MKEKKRLEIIRETFEVTRISFKGNYPRTFFCRSCQTGTPHMTVAETAIAAKLSEVTVFLLTQTGELHYLETETGVLLVCRASLPVPGEK